MDTFTRKFRMLDNIMFAQLAEFAEIVKMLARVTEMSHYPAKFTELVGKVTPGIPTQLDELATNKMFAFLDIVKLQREFLNDLLALPQVIFIPGALGAVVDGHETLDAIETLVTELAQFEGGE